MNTTQDEQTNKLKYTSNIARLDDVSIHNWYRFVYAYSDRVIVDLSHELGISENDLLLDPFNGTGTTTLAAKKTGVDAIGIDTSPASVLSAKAKTTWDIDLEEFRKRRKSLLQTVQPIFRQISSDNNKTLSDFTEGNKDRISLARYNFDEPEKTPKGWLSEKPLKKMVVLRHHVEEMSNDEVTDLFELAMIAILPESVGNVRFGPEATRDRKQKGDKDVLQFFKKKLDLMEKDLSKVQKMLNDRGDSFGEAEVLQADARKIGDTLRDSSKLFNSEKHENEVDYVITSPPYPAEHDYTRNQRLELIWLGAADNNKELQKIKKSNIRSHTKNIYVADNEGEQVSIRENERVDSIISRMEDYIEDENISHGFGNYYPRVVEEYFGGMHNHLDEVYNILAPGGVAAYVVGDSGSYWQFEIETAKILGEIAEEKIGFKNSEIKLWRNMAATTADYDNVPENILTLEKPDL